MDEDLDVNEVAGALRENIGLLLRRLRQERVEGELTLPESSGLTRLNRGGPATLSALAKLEQISPQSMGATLAALEARGLVERHPCPGDRRRVVLSVTGAGRQVLRDQRNARTQQLAKALSAGFPRGAQATDGGGAAARATGAEHLMSAAARDGKEAQMASRRTAGRATAPSGWRWPTRPPPCSWRRSTAPRPQSS